MAKNKSLLFICGDLPYPIVSGGRKREFQLVTELSNVFEVNLLCITRNMTSDKNNSRYLSKYTKKICLLPTRPYQQCVLSPSLGVENLFKRFHTEEVKKWLQKNIPKFDVIHVERGIVVPSAFLKESAPLIISEQSILSDTIQQLLDLKITPNKEEKKLKNYLRDIIEHEKIVWEAARKIMTIVEKNAQKIKPRIKNPAKVFVIPPLIQKRTNLPVAKPINGTIHLIYLGNFNYFPNLISIDKIFNKIIPILDKTKINYRIKIIGNAAGRVKNFIKTGLQNNHCEIIGYTENLQKYWKWAHLSLIPIYCDGGIKTKILESLENGVPVITTNEGINGFENYTNTFVFPFKTAKGISLLIKDFLENPQKLSKIIFKLARKNLNWSISPEFSSSIPDFYKEFTK